MNEDLNDVKKDCRAYAADVAALLGISVEQAFDMSFTNPRVYGIFVDFVNLYMYVQSGHKLID